MKYRSDTPSSAPIDIPQRIETYQDRPHIARNPREEAELREQEQIRQLMEQHAHKQQHTEQDALQTAPLPTTPTSQPIPIPIRAEAQPAAWFPHNPREEEALRRQEALYRLMEERFNNKATEVPAHLPTDHPLHPQCKAEGREPSL